MAMYVVVRLVVYWRLQRLGGPIMHRLTHDGQVEDKGPA